MSAEPVVNGVGGTDEQTDNVDDVNSKKTVKYDSGAADLEKVTDYAEEKEVISTDDISGAMTIIGDRRLKEAADKIAKEKELQKVSIKKSDVELIIQEMEISKTLAERTLRECHGDVVKALIALKKENMDSSFLGKGRYKFWALAAILLLAFWSMFTGTVSLRWSGNLNSLSSDLDTPIHDDLDVLEMEEREKVVRHMWDVYTNSRRIRLPRFWQEAFEAAYEELTSDVPGVRDDAITEIAKMSVRSVNFDPPPIQSTRTQEFSKTLKIAEKGKEAIASRRV